MNTMLRKLRLLLLATMITIPAVSIAQGPDDCSDCPQNDSEVPFDGGVSLLVAAGIGYGLKKVYDKKKAGNTNQESETSAI